MPNSMYVVPSGESGELYVQTNQNCSYFSHLHTVITRPVSRYVHMPMYVRVSLLRETKILKKFY